MYDRPRTPWARVLEYDAESRADGGRGYVDDATRERIENLIASTDPASWAARSRPSRTNSNGSAANAPKAWRADRGWDMGYLGKAIERMRADAEPENK